MAKRTTPYQTTFTVTVEAMDLNDLCAMVAEFEQACVDISNSYRGHISVDETLSDEEA
jgi:hypothetical protein